MRTSSERFRRVREIPVFALLLAYGGMIACSSLSPVSADEQSTSSGLTVEEMIREAVVGDPLVIGSNENERQLAQFSPDGTKAAIIVRRGDPEQGALIAELLLYYTADLLDSPEPQVLAEFSSRSNYQPIAMVRWLDNDTIVFAGSKGDAVPQVYRLSLADRSLNRLTDEKTVIQNYDISDDGNVLMILAERPVLSVRDRADCLKKGCRITSRRLASAASANASFAGRASALFVYDLSDGTRSSVIADPYTNIPNKPYDGLESCISWFTGMLSPDGRFVLRRCRVLQPPEWWNEYSIDESLQTFLEHGMSLGIQQDYLLDLELNVIRPLTGAPRSHKQYFGLAPLWIDGGRLIVQAGAFEPLEHVQGEERTKRATNWGIVTVDPRSGHLESIVRFRPEVQRVTSAQWDEASSTLVVKVADAEREPLPPMAWKLREGVWSSVSAAALPQQTANSNLRLFLHQSVNDRPTLMAEDTVTGARATVLDPNPWLDAVRLGHVEEISWTTAGDRIWRGSLYYPPDYERGKRYPLVIQTHGVQQGVFSLDGYARNFAAQPLATRGMMVLQVDENFRDVVQTPEEFTTVQAGYEEAIDHLDRLGLIDRERVGMIGWSRTGGYVSFVMTRSSYPIAAAMFTDSGVYGWWIYLGMGALSSIEKTVGAAPYGNGLEQWLEWSPAFQLDRVQTPMLMWSAGGVWPLWDWYAGLDRLDKPVELWALPDGRHEVFKVEERLLTNTLLVDWFDFWLNDHEDSDPAKSEQYTRWRDLREKQNTVLAEPRPQLLDWEATPIDAR